MVNLAGLVLVQVTVCAGVGCGLWVEKQKLENRAQNIHILYKTGEGEEHDSFDFRAMAVFAV